MHIRRTPLIIRNRFLKVRTAFLQKQSISAADESLPHLIKKRNLNIIQPAGKVNMYPVRI